MPRKRSIVPQCIGFIKPSGRAIVKLGGRVHYLGKYGSPESIVISGEDRRAVVLDATAPDMMRADELMIVSSPSAFRATL